MSGVRATESEMIAKAHALHLTDALTSEELVDLESDIREACRDFVELKAYATLADLRDDLALRLREAHHGNG